MFRYSILAAVIITANSGLTQQLPDQQRLKNHLLVLASDSLEGRNTGDIGQRKAAAYIEGQLRNMGVAPAAGNGYQQPFGLLRKKRSGRLVIDQQHYRFPEFGFSNRYDTFHFKGKIKFTATVAEADFAGADSSTALLFCVKNTTDLKTSDLKPTRAGVIVVYVADYKQWIYTRSDTTALVYPEKHTQCPILYVPLPGSMPAYGLNGQELTVTLNEKPEWVLTSNVAALIPGSDPELKNEYVVISAHYDHLGVKDGVVYNGADDNGSGSASLLELARLFQEKARDGKGPRRSILLLWMTGEEHGLFGSQYYAEHPIFPLAQTVVDLNVDMIGRTDADNDRKKFRVYLVGADRLSMELQQVSESQLVRHKELLPDYKYNDPQDPLRLYYRSDHYNFAKNGVPSIFYFGGFHDDYHKPTDDVRKLSIPKIQAICSLVYDTAEALANRSERLKIDP